MAFISYIVFQLVGHVIEILLWFGAGAFFGRRTYVPAALLAAVSAMYYRGRSLGPPASQEEIVWMVISALIGLSLGIPYGRRLLRNRNARRPTPEEA